MQFSVHAMFNASAVIADAANHPLLRLFTVGQGTQSPTPLLDLATVEQPWAVASPTTVTDGQDFDYFSATCYMFGLDVQRSLAPGTAIGLISSNWGGTCMQNWAPPNAAIDACGIPSNPNLYNALIHPYVVGPMAINGFIWSQGECNADANQTAYYACAFPAFINAWRAAFNRPNAFFGFQVLPAYVNDSGRFSPYSLPYERAAQLEGLLAGGAVHAANTIDLGDATAPHGSVHPRDKTTVGARLASGAAALAFGLPVPYAAPSYLRADAVTSGTTATVTVTFAARPHAAPTLTLAPAACPAGVGGLPASECSWFDIQTADGSFTNATGVALSADSSQLVLTATVPAGTAVNATRGFFSPWPVVVLFSAEGLPALPWWEPVQTSAVLRA